VAWQGRVDSPFYSSRLSRHFPARLCDVPSSHYEWLKTLLCLNLRPFCFVLGVTQHTSLLEPATPRFVLEERSNLDFDSPQPKDPFPRNFIIELHDSFNDRKHTHLVHEPTMNLHSCIHLTSGASPTVRHKDCYFDGCYYTLIISIRCLKDIKLFPLLSLKYSFWTPSKILLIHNTRWKHCHIIQRCSLSAIRGPHNLQHITSLDLNVLKGNPSSSMSIQICRNRMT